MRSNSGGQVGGRLLDGTLEFFDEPPARTGVAKWIEARLQGVPPGWRRRLGSAFVGGVGTLLVGVPLVHLWLHESSLHALLGDTLPILFGLVLLVASVWLYWGSDDELGPVVTAFWVGAGLLVTGAVALFVISLHTRHGHVVEAGWFLIHDVAATGAVGGLVVGRYDHRTRTQRRRLHRQARQFRAVFEGTLDALIVTDDGGRCVAANPAATDLFAVSRSELTGGNLADVVDDGEDLDARRSAVLERGDGRGTIEVARPDGEVRTAAFAATANVLPGYHLWALRDVTDRIEHERERDEERARVEFINRLLRHNVLNGMNVVLATLATLDAAVPDDRREDLGEVRQRCEEVVDLVQTARRLATRVVTDDGRPIDLVGPLTDAVEAVRADYPDATVDVDRPDGAVVVDADETLERVFAHLLENALEHNDSETVHVRVDVEVGPEIVTVTVADDGTGIPADRRADLFGEDRFAHTRDWGGFGLSIVDVLVEEYGGDVRVAANEPRGTVFVVDLPRAD